MAVLQHCPTFAAEFLLSWPVLFHGVIPSGMFCISEYLASDTLSLIWSSAEHSELQRTVTRDVVKYVQIKIKTANKSQVLYFSYSAHKIRESCWPNSLFLPWLSICKNGVKILSYLTHGCCKDLLSNVRDVLRITRQPSRKLLFLLSEQSLNSIYWVKLWGHMLAYYERTKYWITAH